MQSVDRRIRDGTCLAHDTSRFLRCPPQTASNLRNVPIGVSLLASALLAHFAHSPRMDARRPQVDRRSCPPHNAATLRDLCGSARAFFLSQSRCGRGERRRSAGPRQPRAQPDGRRSESAVGKVACGCKVPVRAGRLLRAADAGVFVAIRAARSVTISCRQPRTAWAWSSQGSPPPEVRTPTLHVGPDARALIGWRTGSNR